MKEKFENPSKLFITAYLIWTSVYIFKQTYYIEILPMNIISKVARIIVYILLIRKFILEEPKWIKPITEIKDLYRESRKDLLIKLFLIVTIFLVTFNTRNINVFDLALFIYSARNIDIKNVMKKALILNIAIMLFVVISSVTGIIKNQVWYRPDSSMRYGLGYTFTTFISNYFFHMVLIGIYLKDFKELDKKVEIIGYTGILLVNYCIYKITDTKAIFYLINLLIVVYLLNKVIKKDLKDSFIKSNLCKYCFPLFTIGTFILTMIYNDSIPILSKLNNLLSGRLALGKNAIQRFGIKLFGQHMVWNNTIWDNLSEVNWMYNYVDSSYINIMVNFGLIIMIILCIGFFVVGKNAVLNNQEGLFIVLLFLSVHSITEPQLIELGYNPFLLLISSLFLTKVKNKEKYLET